MSDACKMFDWSSPPPHFQHCHYRHVPGPDRVAPLPLLRETSKAYHVKEMQCLDRCKNCPLYPHQPFFCYLPRNFSRDSIYNGTIIQLTCNPHGKTCINHPRSVLYMPSGGQCMLFSCGCSEQSGRMRVRWVAEVKHYYLLFLF